jgi:hypothetical protein
MAAVKWVYADSCGLILAFLCLPFALVVGWLVWKPEIGRKTGVGFASLSGALIFGGP